jgi:hypothetical protein
VGIAPKGPGLPVFNDLTATFDAALSLLLILTGDKAVAFREGWILVALGSTLGLGEAKGTLPLERPSPDVSCPWRRKTIDSHWAKNIRWSRPYTLSGVLSIYLTKLACLRKSVHLFDNIINFVALQKWALQNYAQSYKAAW